MQISHTEIMVELTSDQDLSAVEGRWTSQVRTMLQSVTTPPKEKVAISCNLFPRFIFRFQRNGIGRAKITISVITLNMLQINNSAAKFIHLPGWPVQNDEIGIHCVTTQTARMMRYDVIKIPVPSETRYTVRDGKKRW